MRRSKLKYINLGRMKIGLAIKSKGVFVKTINSFVLNAPFLYPLKTTEKLTVF